MSNFNVQNDKWLEIAFEDRNKTYGAYKLRQESNTTTIKALFFGVGLCTICIGLFSFTSPKTVVKHPYELPDLEPTVRIYEKEKKEEIPETKGTDKPLQNKTKNINTQPKVVTDLVVKPEEDTKKPETNTPFNPNGDPNGNSGPIGVPDGKTTILTNSEKTENTDTEPFKGVLGEEAKFPGGIEKFRNYVAKNYEVPSEFEKDFLLIDLLFTISKEGEMTNIRIVNKVDKALEKEAIRVLQAMPKKWTPGKVNGKPVTSERKFSIKIDLREIEE